MTRDLAAVATLDDRRHCPVSAASNVSPPDDDAPSPTINGIVTSGSSSNGGSSSPKSSSTASTSTGRCGSSSSSSRSGSDDDDSGAAVVRPSNALSTSLLHKDAALVAGKESSNCSNSDDALATADTSTSIGGRLTFYKDGQFIFQLAAHHQQQSFDNQSVTTTPCRWVPVPTVIQQHKNNVKSIGEWPQHQQNKTIWPYLVTSPASESKSPQPIPQPQTSAVKICERKQQQYQHRTTPPPLTPINNSVNVASCTTAVVMATTTNIVRRPSRKCSTAMAAENTNDSANQNWKQESQSRPLSKRSQPYQHQSFIMVATKSVKAQRRLLLLPNRQRRRCRKTRTATVQESLSVDQQPPSINLECVVRNLWCRRHTTELLMRRQLSLKNGGGTDAVDGVPRHVAAATGPSSDSVCPITGNVKRRSAFFPLPTTATDLTVPAAAMITDGMGLTGSSSPSKKYRLGQQQQQQQRRAPSSGDNESVRKSVAQSPSLASSNDHSITAILSGGAAGTKRGGGGVVDSENCHITSTTCTTAAIVAPQQKIPPLSSPAPLSLLRTLLKNPGGEVGGLSPVTASANGGYKHHSGRKRSAAVEPTASVPPSPGGTTVDNGNRSAAMASLASVSTVNDAATAALTALHQLPALHHTSTVAAAGQLAAAGYFNVLYHQAAMAAAAMAYQTHAQLPKSPQPSSLLQSSQQFPSAGNSWKRQPNRRPPPPPPVLQPPAVVGVDAAAASTVVAPYSSPLVTVNGGLLPPATPSPPPLPFLHSSQPVHHHRRHLQFLQQQQQYQPVLAVQQKPSSSYQLHNKRRQQGSGVKLQKTTVTGPAEYGNRLNGISLGAAVDVESSPSADCVPLNLSKDSVIENVGDTSTIETVR